MGFRRDLEESIDAALSRLDVSDRHALIAILLCKGVPYDKAVQQVRFRIEARDFSDSPPVVVSFDFTYPKG